MAEALIDQADAEPMIESGTKESNQQQGVEPSSDIMTSEAVDDFTVDLTGKKVVVVPSDTSIGCEICSDLKKIGAEVIGVIDNSSDVSPLTPRHLPKAKSQQVDISINDIESIKQAALGSHGIIVSLHENESLAL